MNYWENEFQNIELRKDMAMNEWSRNDLSSNFFGAHQKTNVIDEVALHLPLYLYFVGSKLPLWSNDWVLANTHVRKLKRYLVSFKASSV
jgi:hypothetical protein